MYLTLNRYKYDSRQRAHEMSSIILFLCDKNETKIFAKIKPREIGLMSKTEETQF